jgi:hypothetical protein
MADAITEASAGGLGGKGLGIWGKVPRADAIRIARQFLEDEARRIQDALNTPDDQWDVSWRRGMKALPEPSTPDKRGQREIGFHNRYRSGLTERSRP